MYTMLGIFVLCLLFINIIALCWMWIEDDYYEGFGLGAPRFCFNLYDKGLRLWFVVVATVLILPAIIIDTIIFFVVVLFSNTRYLFFRR